MILNDTSLVVQASVDIMAEELKTTSTHPAAYKSVYVDTSSGKLYSQDVPTAGAAVGFHLSNVVWVAKEGGDTNDLKIAVEDLCPNGGVVLIAPGTYEFETIVISNVTIKGLGNVGDVTLISTNNSEPAFAVNEARMSIENVTIISTNDAYGGAIYFNTSGSGNVFSNSTIYNCIFENCYSSSDGGAIYLGENTYLEIINCTFNKCNAYYSGGGILDRDGNSFKINNCLFVDCNCGSIGGGMRCSGATIVKCTFDSCDAGNAGGLHVNNCIVDECTIKNCTCNDGSGGGISADSSKIYNTIFEDCICKYDSGGGIYAINNCTINNSSFINCKARYGGGILSSHSKINNCTFDSCTALFAAGAAYISSSSISHFTTFDYNGNKTNGMSFASGGCGVAIVTNTGFIASTTTDF